MKTYIPIILFLLIAYELSNVSSQRFKSNRNNRQRPNQQKQGLRSQANKSQRLGARGSNQQRFNKPRQGKQGGSKGSTSRMSCDFAAHYVTDNAEFFIDRTDGLFGEDWTFDNGCENHDLGCCAEDEDCKCFGIIEEMDEDLEEPPRCYPLNRARSMPAPQFCMRQPQRGRRNRN